MIVRVELPSLGAPLDVEVSDELVETRRAELAPVAKRGGRPRALDAERSVALVETFRATRLPRAVPMTELAKAFGVSEHVVLREIQRARAAGLLG